MIEPKIRSGARALLFDRLVDLEPQTQKEIRPLRVLDKKGLKDSVRRELGRLLNTRRPIPLAPPLEERTVINYGIPDFSSLSPHSDNDRRRLEFWMQEAIRNYEPRLVNVKVTVEAAGKDERALTARIDADLQLDTIREPVAFSVLVKRDAGRS
jgi:type VI secretion system protein ImpF